MMTGCVPYLASAEWYGLYMRRLLDGADEREAISAATASMRLNPRDMARTMIAGVRDGLKRQPSIRLSVPIEGGASAVKRLPCGRWRISDHGRWQAMHLGALEAAYASAPYFAHLFPEISATLQNAFPGDFSNLTLRLHEIIMRMLHAEETLPHLRMLLHDSPELAAGLRRDNYAASDKDLSFLHVIFHKGPSAIFGLT